MQSAKSNDFGGKEAELAMLGAFVGADENRAEILQTVDIKMLLDDKVRTAWRHITAMYASNAEIGLYELTVVIERAGDGAVCDREWLWKVVNEWCPNDHGGLKYAERVRDCWTRRRLSAQVKQIDLSLSQPDAEQADLLKVHSDLSALLAERAGSIRPTHISEGLGDAMDAGSDIQAAASTGVPKLDQEINLYEPCEMSILAARPGGGKSSFMRQLAWNASARGPVLLFSLEVSPRVLTQQITCEVAQVPFESWRRRAIASADNERIIDAMSEVAERPIYIFPRANVSSLDVAIAVSHMTAIGKPPILVAIDYLGLMKHDRLERQDLAIGATTRAVKLMALEKRVPVLLLCQMNRQSEQRGNASEYDRPRLADLRDSGNIEQDADNIIFLWRRNRDEYSTPVVERVFTVAKRRNGSIFETDLMFDMPKGRFFAVSKYPTPEAEIVGSVK